MFPPKSKFLVVDDMRTMRSVINKGLRALGYQDVEEANDGAQAWRMLETSVVKNVLYNLIISDWTMPKVTGLELLKKVREHPVLKSLPFLMVTGESDMEQVKEAIAAGVTNYVTKPFTQDTFKAKIAAVWKVAEKTQKTGDLIDLG